MLKTTLATLILSGLFTLCLSCSTILYGYNKVQNADYKWTTEIVEELNLDPQNLHFFDSLESTLLLNFICSSNQAVQPLQLHYILGDSTMSSYYNCYAQGGIRNIHWAFQDPDHHLIDGDCISNNMHAIKQLRQTLNVGAEDLILVVFSSMFKRQSEDLIRTSITRSIGYTLILANIDEYYSKI